MCIVISIAQAVCYLEESHDHNSIKTIKIKDAILGMELLFFEKKKKRSRAIQRKTD